MIDESKLELILTGYKESFSKHWPNEKFKWEAVKCFQDNWDIDATDFGEMFGKATEKTGSLLTLGKVFPRGMIMEFAKADNEATRQMFRDLFDETKELAGRVDAFKEAAEIMRVKYDDGSWNHHYQNTNAISTYLWLRFPDKYYIYKYELMKDAAKLLGSTYRPKANGSAESMIGGYGLYDEICEIVQKDDEICQMISEALTEDCWPDTQMRTTTIDVVHYMSKFYNVKTGPDDEWFPTDYNPGLTTEDWKDLLNDDSVFTLHSLEVMKRMLDYGGQATCSQLSIKYGESMGFYNAVSVALAKRVAEKTGCPVMKHDNGDSRWWTILYTGKNAEANTEGVYIWRLRDELSEALKETDLSEVPLYENPTPAIWKISHGDIPTEQRALFRERQVVVVNSRTRAKGGSKIPQGQEFIDGIKKGDYFYLCYGNSIQLFGQFTTDNAVPNPEKEDGWYEREYNVIADSKDTSAYTNTDKWWAPNDNSTCIKVNDDEKPLFEELILKPYFGMTLNDLYDTAAEPHGYWWLVANPKIWSFSNMQIGKEQNYTLYNENGHKRHIFQNFLDAKAGDVIVCYESYPVKKIVALAEITKENDGENLYFKKTEGLSSPIDYDTLKECPELENMEFFTQSKGSLFKLTKDEYDFIMDMVREENPLPKQDVKIKPYTKEDFLNQVYMSAERYDTLRELLLNKMNIILQGAPGVGKTYAAKRLAYSIMGEEDENRIEMIQFHQNYSYEDFIMGYRPDGDTFELTDGVFYRFCQTARSDKGHKYFFIIDEINRGNMSKIFGELLMLIEKDYRETSAILAYNGLPFSVPDNLYIIGMMNTADRSLAMIDYALRRRFSFFEIDPAFDSEGFKKYQASLDNETFDALIDQIKELNKAIRNDQSLGKGFMIGHSYFCGRTKEDCTTDWMRSVVEFDILPMLSEYWFDEPEKYNRWERNLDGVFDDE